MLQRLMLTVQFLIVQFLEERNTPIGYYLCLLNREIPREKARGEQLLNFVSKNHVLANKQKKNV